MPKEVSLSAIDLETRRRKAGITVAQIARALNRPYPIIWRLLNGGYARRVDVAALRAVEDVIAKAEVERHEERN